jgi:hypothetical protein
MNRIKSIAVATCVAVTLAAGIVYAQGPTPFTRPNLELIATQESLGEAIQHLRQARPPNNVAVTRALAFIALAHTELAQAGGVQGLQTNPE